MRLKVERHLRGYLNVVLSYKKSGMRSSAVGKALRPSIQQYDTLIDDVNAADVIIAYGVGPTHKHWYEQYKSKKRFIWIDLGYWSRGSQRSKDASYKLSLDYWHPQKWMDLDCKPDRFLESGLRIRNQKLGENILLAGLGPKGSGLYGYEHQDWEKRMVEEIRKHTDKPIVYRPKPSDRKAPKIDGTIYRSNFDITIDEELDQTGFVVSHHSNVTVDALLRGIPFYAEDGAAMQYSVRDLSYINSESRIIMRGRSKFFANLAYFNHSITDMNTHITWKFFRKLILENAH